MLNVFVGPVIETLVLFLPAFLCFKSRSEFRTCFYSFIYVGSRSTKRQESRSVKFAVYFAIVLFGSIINLMFFL